MLEVDETFTTIWLSIIRGQGQGQEMTSVPLGTIFVSYGSRCCAVSIHFTVRCYFFGLGTFLCSCQLIFAVMFSALVIVSLCCVITSLIPVLAVVTHCCTLGHLIVSSLLSNVTADRRLLFINSAGHIFQPVDTVLSELVLPRGEWFSVCNTVDTTLFTGHIGWLHFLT